MVQESTRVCTYGGIRLHGNRVSQGDVMMTQLSRHVTLDDDFKLDLNLYTGRCKCHTLDIDISEGTTLQKRTGMARAVERFQFYLPPTSLSRNGMNRNCLCLSSRS